MEGCGKPFSSKKVSRENSVLQFADLVAVLGDVIRLHADFVHPALHNNRLPRVRVVALAGIVIPEPRRSRPQTGFGRYGFVKRAVTAVLPVMRHLTDIRLQLFRHETEHLLSGFHAAVAGDEDSLAAERYGENHRRIVADVAVQFVVVRIQYFDVRRADVEFVPAGREADTVGEHGKKLGEFGHGAFRARVLTREELNRREVEADAVHVHGVGHLAHDLEKYADVVVMRMCQEPCIDVRTFLSGDGADGFEEMVGLRRETAVHNEDFSVFGGNNKAETDRIRHGAQHINSIFHGVCPF